MADTGFPGYQGRRRRPIGVAVLVRRAGCLSLLAAALVTAVLLVIAIRVFAPPLTLWGKAPQAGVTRPVPPPPPPPTPAPEPPPVEASPTQKPTVARYEAEDTYVWLGKVESNHDGYSGTGFVNYDNQPGGLVQWTFESAQPGRVTLRLRYANWTEQDRPLDIIVNGQANAVSFPSTGSWTSWKTRTLEVDLYAGPNEIRAVATGPDGGPNLDYLEIRY